MLKSSLFSTCMANKMSVKKQRYDLIRKIKRLRKKNDITTVFVCGYGGAGKTTFCNYLLSKLEPNAVLFECDWFLKYATFVRRAQIKTALESGNARRIIEEENPKNWYDWMLLTTSLKTLMEERSLTLEKAWSQETGNKDLDVKISLPTEPGSVIIVDGIYLLHDTIRDIADHIVLLEVPITHCIETSTNRDAHRSTKSYLEYKVSLLFKYDKPYFQELKNFADTVVEMPVQELKSSTQKS